jgi:hypothetical protein
MGQAETSGPVRAKSMIHALSFKYLHRAAHHIVWCGLALLDDFFPLSFSFFLFLFLFFFLFLLLFSVFFYLCFFFMFENNF